MENSNIPPDDITDVEEMTKELEKCFISVLKENEITLSISALMSSTINIMISKCQTLNDVFFCKKLLVESFDIAIETIKNQKTKNFYF